MSSSHTLRQLDRSNFVHRTHYTQDTSWADRFQQPGVLVSIILLALAILYQYFRSSAFIQSHSPGSLLCGGIATVLPAKLLYALDDWLNPPMFAVAKKLQNAQPGTHAAKIEALQRILGMDKPNGLINSVAHAGKRSITNLSTGRVAKCQVQEPPGLRNWDNSCFQNSILQGLASLNPLPPYLEKATDDIRKEVDNGSEGSAATLYGLIAKLTDHSNNGATLTIPAKLKSLDTWQQQDAQEYFSKILDEVDKEVTKATKEQLKLSAGLDPVVAKDDTESQHSDDSGYQSLSALSKASLNAQSLHNPLEGLSAQRVACVQCGHSEGLSMIPFNCLTLNLGVNDSGHDLMELLDSYTHLEAIDGVECGKCSLLKVQKLLKIIVARSRETGISENNMKEPLSRLQAVEMALEDDDFDEKTLSEKCKISSQHRVSATKTKQVAVARAPKSLAIHMNRSVFDETTGHMFKNLAHVRFPQMLDLGPWCLGSAGGSATSFTGIVDGKFQFEERPEEKAEQWLAAPRSSMVAGDTKPSKISGPLYELRAVVTHQGRHENGHYVCYRQHVQLPPKLQDEQNMDCEVTSEENKIQDADADASFDDAGSQPDNGSKWWRLSDESVWEVDEETVLAQGGVFMLFYDCVDPNPVFISQTQAKSKFGEQGLEPDDDKFVGTFANVQVQGEKPAQSPRGNGSCRSESTYPSALMPMLSASERIDASIPSGWPNK